MEEGAMAKELLTYALWVRIAPLLTKFRNPKLVEIEPAIVPPNTLGLRSAMFTVESVDDTVARLRAQGAELVGEVAQYEDKYRLCYMRGPAGIIVALAEKLF
jgi:hypothetical protein